jgi:hypothetical protein
MATSKRIRYDAFIESVRPNPKSTEELVLLQGYIGKSDLSGHIRVYSDPALSDFIELPEPDILHCEPVSTEEDPLGGSRLWVRKTTVFTTGDPSHANRVRSSFLEGDLMRAFGDSGLGAQAFSPQDIPGGGGGNTLNPTCPSIGNGACITNNPPCTIVVTRFSPCTVTGPVSFTRPSCFRTCFTPSCFRTCNSPSCFRTCLTPTCLRTCFRTCQWVCQIAVPQTRICEVEVNFPGVNPLTPPAGYAGGFNPYDTFNYGY